MKNRINRVVFSLDFIVALVVCLGFAVSLPSNIKNDFARDVYGIGISVLSIIFSVYFAALAIIISSSDDDFVKYLQERGRYQIIIESFQWTLIWLFFALIYSIIAYILTSFSISNKVDDQSKIFFIIFSGIFAYSLFAAFLATKDSLQYAKFRAKFLDLSKKNKNERD